MTHINDVKSDVQAGFALRSVFLALKNHDVMGHKAVYELLEPILAGCPSGYRLLDIGCGDCADILPALHGTSPGEYVGVDSSTEAMGLAARHCAAASFPVRLIQGDFREALGWDQKFDVIWMGLFLHHLPSGLKRDFLLQAHERLNSGGLLLAHDPLLREGEDRGGFIARLEEHGRACWSFLSTEDLDVACRHWGEHGHQECCSDLMHLGHEAGFAEISLLWSDPDAFYGLLRFRRI